MSSDNVGNIGYTPQPQLQRFQLLSNLAQRGQALMAGFLPETQAVLNPITDFSTQPVAQAPSTATAAYPAAPAQPVAAAQPAQPARQVYVLHSGMNDPTNVAATQLRQQLLARGIPASNIIVLDNPYPSFSTGGYSNNVDTYNNSADPNSQAARDAYQRFQAALRQNGVRPTDNITWVGHSAGGQMGLTMAEMASQDPQAGYRLGTVITLGSPILRNRAPQETRVLSFVSQSDSVLNMTTGRTARFVMGRQVYYTPPNQDDNDAVYNMPGVAHNQWYNNGTVMDRIMAATQPQQQPAAGNAVSRFFGRVGQMFRGNTPQPAPSDAPPQELPLMTRIGARISDFFQGVVNFFSNLFGGRQAAPQS